MRRPAAVQVWLGAVVLLTVGFVVGGSVWGAIMIERLQTENREQRIAMDRIVGQYADLYAQARAEGVTPDSPDPADVVNALPTPPAGERGPTGPGPSVSDVLGAVTAYCDSRGNCRGPAGPASTTPGPAGPAGSDSTVPGPQGATGRPGEASTIPGPAGRPPTAEEIAAAVASYCAANNGCRGADGANGADGEPGPGPTDAQVAAAVESYCSEHPGCGPAPAPSS